jgi:hypothetical protein
MRYFVPVIILLGIIVVGFKSPDSPAASAPAAVQQAEPNIGFQWAFGALVGDNKQLVPITRDTVLKSGEEIKMMVKLTKDCFVYCIHQGPNGELDVLFPYNIKKFNFSVDKNYYIPKGRTWITLDKNTGKEIFFLLASTERLLDIETKISDYFDADASKKPALAATIVNEIRGARQRFATFATLAEKPLTIGGNVRGTEKVEESHRPDVADIATEISANNFYGKTITIDHQ